MSDLTDLTRAASSALIDMRLDSGWEAIETDHRTPGRVVVTLQRAPAPVECVCPDPESEQIDPSCVLCIEGEPEPEHAEVEFSLKVLA